MFTGIIERIGAVGFVSPQASGVRVSICAPGFWSGLPSGASVAIDGVCLTLVAVAGDSGEFDVIHETLRRSTLGELRAGSAVNLERALQAGARLDGHFVQGHVDAIATIARIDTGGGESRWTFGLDANSLRYIIPKGGVAIDGISLTVTQVAADSFGVALIPATLERTTLGRKRVGQRVNIETDILARTVVHSLESMVGQASGLTLEKLRKQGFA